MSENPLPIRLLAREIIEQCRREIAAAWEQVEAGRRILNHSAWLLQRWSDMARRVRLAPPPYLPRTAGSFEAVETPRERLSPRRLTRMRLSGHAAAAAQRLQPQGRAPRPH